MAAAEAEDAAAERAQRHGAATLEFREEAGRAAEEAGRLLMRHAELSELYEARGATLAESEGMLRREAAARAAEAEAAAGAMMGLEMRLDDVSKRLAAKEEDFCAVSREIPVGLLRTLLLIGQSTGCAVYVGVHRARPEAE